MADMLQGAAAYLAAQLQANASQTITYLQKASGLSVQVPGTLGRSLLKINTDFGERIEFTDRDFLIGVATLVAAFAEIGVTFTTPTRGDTAAVTLAGVTETCQVLAPGSEPPWRFSDPYRTLFRIHGKRVS